ncbi:MAG: methyltransferase domain-containing protein [Proteobacteria bacterium]|nr:methyltransferase domain-containing protein [Pseudomonadota bacterium]
MRRLIELITTLLGWSRYKLGFRIKSTSGMVKVNLGCGLAVTTGWINVDGSLNAFVATLPEVFHRLAFRLSGANRYYSEPEYRHLLASNTFFHANLSYGIPSKNESVDFVYSSHFLEHLCPSEAESFLRECLRILKPGGVIRVCVPDLAYAMKMYSSGRKQEALDKYFFVEDKGSFYARHKYMYDLELLSNLLSEIGFKSIRQYDYRVGNVPDIELLDNRPEDTLFVEAKK